MNYCAVHPKNEVYAIGSKEEIVCQLGTVTFSETRELWYHVKGFNKSKFHRYNDDYTVEEMYKHAIDFLFSELRTGYRFILYQNMYPFRPS